MQKKHLKIILPLIFFIAFFIFLSFDRNNVSINTESEIINSAVNLNDTDIAQISTDIAVGDRVFNFYHQEGLSLYNVLYQAKEKGEIVFKGKNYPGLGFFVTDIGTLHGGDGKNLIYYINGIEAEVGISIYIPQNGDIISWKLE